MQLFADQNDAKTAFLIAVSTLMGAGINWLAGQVKEWFREKRKNQLDDEAREDAKETKLVDRLDAERIELREQIRKLDHQYDELQKELRIAMLKAERMVGYLLYYERLLKNANIPHDPWPRDTPSLVDSSLHAPLQPETTREEEG